MTKPSLRLVTPDFEPKPDLPPVKHEGNAHERLRAAARTLNDEIENQKKMVRDFRSTIEDLRSVSDLLGKSTNRYRGTLKNICVDRLRRKSLRLVRIMEAYEDNTAATGPAIPAGGSLRLAPGFRRQTSAPQHATRAAGA